MPATASEPAGPGSEAAKPTSRRRARRRALEVLYEADMRREPIRTVLARALARDESAKPAQFAYGLAIVEGVADHRDRIDELIASYSEGWTLDRMPAVDRNLARIAIYEMLYAAETDDAVAINEAVELAEQMSTDDSPRFLNALLDRIAQYTAH